MILFLLLILFFFILILLIIYSIYLNTKEINEFIRINKIKRKKLKDCLRDVKMKAHFNKQELNQVKDQLMLNSMDEYNEECFLNFE